MANSPESSRHILSDFRAPPPSPVASSRQSSVANDEVLTEFLRSLHVPDLVLKIVIYVRKFSIDSQNLDFKRSARSTFPDLINFRVAKLNGFRRVFAHVAPIFFERGIAKPETKEISSLSVEPCEGESLIVIVFEIKKLEIPSFIEREHEFRFLAVSYYA
ncbi:hypothetical protein LXL04_035141 [Taraxacum kok-saghyz]